MYGYVVGCSPFGDAYVVCLTQVLQQVQACFGAHNVALSKQGPKPTLSISEQVPLISSEEKHSTGTVLGHEMALTAFDEPILVDRGNSIMTMSSLHDNALASVWADGAGERPLVGPLSNSNRPNLAASERVYPGQARIQASATSPFDQPVHFSHSMSNFWSDADENGSEGGTPTSMPVGNGRRDHFRGTIHDWTLSLLEIFLIGGKLSGRSSAWGKRQMDQWQLEYQAASRPS